MLKHILAAVLLLGSLLPAFSQGNQQPPGGGGGPPYPLPPGAGGPPSNYAERRLRQEEAARRYQQQRRQMQNFRGHYNKHHSAGQPRCTGCCPIGRTWVSGGKRYTCVRVR